MNKRVIVIGGLAIGGVMVFALTRKAKAEPPLGGWCCPYDPAHGCFETYADLVSHVMQEHPGQRLPINITWR